MKRFITSRCITSEVQRKLLSSFFFLLITSSRLNALWPCEWKPQFKCFYDCTKAAVDCPSTLKRWDSANPDQFSHESNFNDGKIFNYQLPQCLNFTGRKKSRKIDCANIEKSLINKKKNGKREICSKENYFFWGEKQKLPKMPHNIWDCAKFSWCLEKKKENNFTRFFFSLLSNHDYVILL